MYRSVYSTVLHPDAPSESFLVSMVNICKLFADEFRLFLNVRSHSCYNPALGLSPCQREIEMISFGVKY